MLKKLFTIRFNGKRFLVLVDDNHRKTFLEADKNGKLSYPTLEDFKYLNKIYNEKDPLISYAIKYYYTERLFDKNQPVDLKQIIAAGLISSLSLTMAGSIIIASNKASNRSFGEAQSYFISQYKESITKENVVDAINNNSNFSEREKRIALKLLDDMLELDPNIDLRIYYENIKDLKIEYIPYDKLHEETKEYISGYYSGYHNLIKVVDDCSDFVIAHEILHSGHNLYTVLNGQRITIYEKNASFLAEAMTNKIVSKSFEYNYTYYTEKLILDYLLYFADKFDYREYFKNGVQSLIDELKEKYLDIDIDYIVDFFETNKDTAINLNQGVLLSEEYDVLDELFKIAVASANKDNVYESFSEFLKLTDNNSSVFERYFDLYVNALQDLIDKEKLDFVKSADTLYMTNSNTYICDGKYYYDYDGNKHEVSDGLIFKMNVDTKNSILECYFKNTNIFSKEFIDEVMTCDVLFSSVKQLSSPEECKEFLSSLFNSITSTDNYSELNRLYDEFARKMLSYSTLSIYFDEYADKFNQIIEKKGNFTHDEYETLNKIEGIFEYKGNYYLGTGKLSNGSIYPNLLIGDGNYYKRCFVLPASTTIEYIDDNGNLSLLPIDTQTIKFYAFYYDIKNNFINYFYNIKGDKFNKENIDAYLKESNIIESASYINMFTLSDGTKVYDGPINDNILLEIGKDSNDHLAYKLLNKEEELYSKGVIDGNSVTIKYIDYLNASFSFPKEYLNEILEEEAMLLTLNKLDSIIPNMNANTKYYTKTYTSVDSKGEKTTSYAVRGDVYVDFVDSPKVTIDGNIRNMNDIYVLADIDDNIYLYFGNNEVYEFGTSLGVDIHKESLFSLSLEECLEYYNIKPINDTYTFTKNEIIEIFANYLKETLDEKMVH